jgi:hypothetical protein
VIDRIRRRLRRELREAVRDATTATNPYRNTYSVLTIHFAEGSKPAAISIPYSPFENRTDINLPLRVVEEES